MLISAHQWMGVKSMEALETFLNFIAKRFLNRHKMINKEQAINLYSTIAQRINANFLDLVSLEPERDEFGEEVSGPPRMNQVPDEYEGEG